MNRPFVSSEHKPVILLAALVLLQLPGCGQKADLPPLMDDDVILAFGNSLTFGTGAKKHESYPAVLQGLAGRTVVNGGVPGEISQLGLARLPDLLDKHQPKLLILCHGGNDILRKHDLEKTAANIIAMINLARERDIPVIMLGVPKVGLLLSPAEIYNTIAEETGVIYIDDLLPDVLSDKALKSDTVHPNKLGYRKMAEEIFELLDDSGVI